MDNPPFSIFARILKWYNERGIDFSLFAPSLTSIREGVTFVSVDAVIQYENGARVSTAFVTNMMGNLLCITAPELNKNLNEAEIRRQLSLGWVPQKKYRFPASVLRASTINCMTRRGIHFSVSARDGKIMTKKISKGNRDFANSIILCDRKIKEREDLYNEPNKPGYIEIELTEQAKAEIERLNALDRINNPQFYD